MDEALHMSVNTGERIVSIERLSRGTLEQIYFALRMAAGELGGFLPDIAVRIIGIADIICPDALCFFICISKQEIRE